MELENANSLTTEQFRATIDQLRMTGVNLNDVESAWFQIDRGWVELEMHDGTRRTLQCTAQIDN
jgi:hypothetical protein